ncbi:MAG: HNH endonuclease [Myxococcales bacterium]|nr:HNH endonuclease [Myxococcales bacterium]
MTTWTEAEIRERFARLAIWRRAGVRAPHKPLLALYALARTLDPEAARLVPFTEAEPILEALLDQFGRPRTRPRPMYPFWRLQRDGVWEIHERDTVIAAGLTRSGDPALPAIRPAHGGFPAALDARLRADPLLTASLIDGLIRAHFPASRRRELLDALGLPDDLPTTPLRGEAEQVLRRLTLGRPRDPAFRDTLLRAWRGRCAMCGFDAKLKGRPIGIEAAHIQWHAAGGPDAPDNGLLLCALHHHALDVGAIGLEADRRLKVSPLLVGGEQAALHLERLHGCRLSDPDGIAPPAARFIEWHDREVFQGEG